MKTVAIVFAAVFLFAVASAQTGSCPCEQQKETTCTVFGVNNIGLCLAEQVPCSPCVCVIGGTKTCVVEVGTSFQPTGKGQCEVVKTEYAVCPERTIIEEPVIEKTETQLKKLG
eukprot:CAMPEP_0185843896 /NCGR_PEP_ID=MMETSP1354-20130828/267_1 /TAXON_ID=708628 /ORGANISM="Erythrolobus madagascarensis, Strain CCMP3276" /LENGTH=113 /DNA_ID=CAMNT_0028543477 /DNA_START=24 /DNA_END=365 /DNA_ORIENTATION=-